LPVVAALAYEGVAARCIRRLKEEGETLLARPLGAALSTVVSQVASEHGRMPLVVPVPTGRAAFRRRGYRVPELLIRRAGLPVSRVLMSARATADQRGLGIEARGRNVAASMRARHARDSHEVLLIDDVVTTGATLDEGARALRSAGFRVLGAVALAATPLHIEFSANTS
jgi:predicted amidophosphoribosyltransferase